METEEIFDGNWEDESTATDEPNARFAGGDDASADESDNGAARESGREEEFLEFARERPDVTPDKIPKEVWAKIAGGERIRYAWMEYENGSMRDRLRSFEQGERNRQRSAGSRKSGGKSKGADPFDVGWSEI